MGTGKCVRMRHFWCKGAETGAEYRPHAEVRRVGTRQRQAPHRLMNQNGTPVRLSVLGVLHPLG